MTMVVLLAFMLMMSACGSPSNRQSLAAAAVARDVKITYCVRSWGEARYRGFGYHHVVHLANECDRTVACAVSTDVSPSPTNVSLKPDAHVQVVTRKSSPSRKFTPRVSCHFVKDN